MLALADSVTYKSWFCEVMLDKWAPVWQAVAQSALSSPGVHQVWSSNWHEHPAACSCSCVNSRVRKATALCPALEPCVHTCPAAGHPPFWLAGHCGWQGTRWQLNASSSPLPWPCRTNHTAWRGHKGTVTAAAAAHPPVSPGPARGAACPLRSALPVLVA